MALPLRAMQRVDSVPHIIPEVGEGLAPSFLKTLWEKIKAIAKRIFDFLFSWRNKPPVFTKEQRNSIQHAIEVRHKLNPENDVVIEVKEIPKKKKEEHVSPPSAEEPALKHLNKFVDEFGQVLVVDCVQNELLKPEIPQLIKWIDQINDTIEPWAKMSTLAIDALDPFIQKINSFTGLPEIIVYAKKLVQLVIENKEHDDKQIPLEWINESNELFLKAKDTNQLINLFLDTHSFFKNFALLLEAGDLQDKIEAIQKCTSSKIEAGFEKLFEVNTPKLMKILSERVDELIFHLPYDKTFDKLVVEIRRHIDVWIIANEGMKVEKSTIEKAQLVAENPNSIQTDTDLSQSYFDKVNNEGGEEEYLNKIFIDNYRQEYENSFIARKKLKDEDAQVDIERLEFLNEESPEKIRGEFYSKFAETIYQLLLPTKEVKLPLDTSVRLNGLVDLWDMTELCEPFTEILKHIEDIITFVIDNSNLENPEIFRTYLTVLVKKFLLEKAHQQVKGVIATGIRNIFHKLTDPPDLEEMFADTALPAIVNQLIVSFARTLLLRNITQMAPLFEEYIDKPDTPKKEKILSSLFELVEKNTEHYDLEQDRDTFDSLVSPLITELSENLLNRLKKDAPNKKLTAEEVEVAILAYFESEQVETNPEYGEIVMKLLFKMGSFGGGFKEWVLSFMKGTIAQGVTLALKDTQKSYHQVVNSATNALRKNYLNPEDVRKAFFSPPQSAEEIQLNRDRVKLELPKQIHRVAALTRDILYENLYANSSWVKPYHRFTPSVETLEGTITNIFKNLFKRDLLNQNFLLQGFHILDRALAKSVTNGNLQKRIHSV